MSTPRQQHSEETTGDTYRPSWTFENSNLPFSTLKYFIHRSHELKLYVVWRVGVMKVDILSSSGKGRHLVVCCIHLVDKMNSLAKTSNPQIDGHFVVGLDARAFSVTSVVEVVGELHVQSGLAG